MNDESVGTGRLSLTGGIASPRVFAETMARPSSLETTVTALFDRHRSPLLRYLTSFGLTLQDGEEVVQEVFLALYEHLRRGRSERNLPGWIFKVAHNQGLKRRQANRRGHELASGLAGNPGLHSGVRTPDPETQMRIGQRRERLLDIVEALPDRDRQCLYLRAEGLRYREIAEVLGLSLGGVALSLKRSLTLLIERDGDGE